MLTQIQRHNPEEYLQNQEQADYKSEYHHGEIIPTTGDTTNHNEPVLNLVSNL